ncbi:hypothetical protein GCM10020000_72890 [Streptomyces olivoverticillatus]
MPLVQQPQERAPHCVHGRLVRLALADRADEELHRLGDPVEEEVFLAREVVEDGHRRDLGGPGDLGDGDVVEAPLDEQLRGRVRDALPRLTLLLFAQ